MPRGALIVALGASNTAGDGVGAGLAYPAVIERLLLARGIDARVMNAGVSGNTTSQMLARLGTAVPDGTKLVLFQPGSNDARLGIPETERERNISIIQDTLVARGVAIVRVAAAFETARSEPGNLQPDGVHYTVAGHALIGRLLAGRVAEILMR
jgi:acyl-CoA thioesterase I